MQRISLHGSKLVLLAHNVSRSDSATRSIVVSPNSSVFLPGIRTRVLWITGDVHSPLEAWLSINHLALREDGNARARDRVLLTSEQN